MNSRSRQGLSLAAAAAIVVGSAAEMVSFGLGDPGRWMPDLLVGWICIGCGLVAASRRPDSRIGLLLMVAGFTWYIGNLRTLPIWPLATAAVQLTLVHRAVLVHAALTMPGGRTRGWLQRGAIVGSYVAWSIPATARSPLATASVCAAVVVMAGHGVISGPAPTRRSHLAAVAATALLGAGFTAASAIHSAIPGDAGNDIALLLNEAAIVVAAAGLALVTLLPRLEAGRVTDLVVEAARTRAGGVRAALASALGDPSLEIGYWHAVSGTYLDALGGPVVPAGAHDSRSSMHVDADGQPVAVLVHDPAVLESSALTTAVQTTTVLAAANARLRGDVFDQLTEVRASRQRLVLAGDKERRRLEGNLEHGPMRRARVLAAALDEVAAAVEGRGYLAIAEHVRGARAALDDVSEDLQRLAQGLHPSTITTLGLGAALRSIADRSPVPVEMTYDADGLPETTELAIYYVCAEAIANASKHAGASRISVGVVMRESRVIATVIDDGAGGADPSAGTGLRGIQDRIEALDGQLTLRSEAGIGTGLRVEIPITMP